MSDTTSFAPPRLASPAHWHRTGLLIGLVAAVLSAMLGWMVWDRVTLLRNGREIVMPVIPVDPRSLFRGDYVILGYSISQVPAPEGQTEPATAGQPVFVQLEQDGDSWKAVSSTFSIPASVPTNRIVLRGIAMTPFWRSASTPQVRVRYGIESYFVPEGKGLDLERLVQDKKLAARIAVDAKGRAAIKGLIVDGKPVYEEPLF